MTVITEKVPNPMADLYKLWDQEIRALEQDPSNCKLYGDYIRVLIFGMKINPNLKDVLAQHGEQLILIHFKDPLVFHTAECASNSHFNIPLK